jgi:hypothetical protein
MNTSPPKVVEPEKRGISWSFSMFRQTFSGADEAGDSDARASWEMPVNPMSVPNIFLKADLLGWLCMSVVFLPVLRQARNRFTVSI